MVEQAGRRLPIRVGQCRNIRCGRHLIQFVERRECISHFRISSRPKELISTVGGVWRYNLNTTTWANITPAMPSRAATSGFVGLAVDAENPNTVVVTTFDHYNGGDFIFRSTTANAATPTWVSLFGGDSTRNTTSSPWIAAFTDGIGNWAATAAIDPFNPAHIVYGTGQGLWTTLTGNSSTTLTAPNSWYFKDYGIDFTAVIGLNAAPTGVPLFSGIGDINGFAHTTLTSSPAAGAICSRRIDRKYGYG